MPKGRRPRGVTPRPRSGAVAESARLRWCRIGREELPKSKVRGKGQKELPHIQGQGWRLRGATPHQRPGAAAGRTNPTSREWWLCRRRRAQRNYPTLKVRKGGDEEIPLVQGKEKQLNFAGAAVKRFPMPKVRETQVRWQVLQEGIREQTHLNHTHRKLVSLITLGPQPCLTQ